MTGKAKINIRKPSSHLCRVTSNFWRGRSGQTQSPTRRENPTEGCKSARERANRPDRLQILGYHYVKTNRLPTAQHLRKAPVCARVPRSYVPKTLQHIFENASKSSVRWEVIRQVCRRQFNFTASSPKQSSSSSACQDVLPRQNDSAPPRLLLLTLAAPIARSATARPRPAQSPSGSRS